MEILPLTGTHIAKLEEYGLQDVPRSSCSYMRFEPGEAITREGSFISWVAVVISGQAKACRTAANGRSLILCQYISDGIIGEIELLTGQTTAVTTVTAISNFECVAVSRQSCVAELSANVAFYKKLATVLAKKLAASADNLASSVLCTGEQRLCSYILRTSHNGVFSDVLTDVSCSVGLSYRHMFRLLGQLCEEGVLERRESGYFILDHDELIRRSHVQDLALNRGLYGENSGT